MGNNFRTTQAGDKFPADGQANYLHFTAYGGHAGMGKNDNNGDGVDHCNIAGWKVPEDHIYSITHSLLQSSSKTIYGAISDGWVSGLDGIAIHVLTDDTVVCSRHTTEGKSPHVDFNCLLGEVKKGVMIYVAICPNGTGGFDGFTVDYSIAKGVVPSINAASEHKVTADDVVELMDHDVACFSKDYPQKNGFTYMYNPDGLITEPSKFKPLVSYNRDQYFTIAGKPSSSENGWLKIGQTDSHPGGGGQFAIVEWVVRTNAESNSYFACERLAWPAAPAVTLSTLQCSAVQYSVVSVQCGVVQRSARALQYSCSAVLM